MNSNSRILYSLLMFFLGLIISSTAISQPVPERDYFSAQDADPFEVSLYADKDYKNLIGTWKLSPGMRMLKIPNITKKPESIFLGSKVAAYLFFRSDFSAYIQMRQSGGGDINYIHMRYVGLQNSSPLITGIPAGQTGGLSSQPPPSGFSLVIHRKDVPDILGVYLVPRETSFAGSGVRARFYSLPDAANDIASVYNKLPHGGPFLLELVPGGKQVLAWSAKGGVHPNANDIEITVDFSNGASAQLPGATSGSPPASWDLGKISNGQISSIKMRYTGPAKFQHYSQQEPSRHRAPPAKQQTPPSVQMQPGQTGPAAASSQKGIRPLPGTGMPPSGLLPQMDTGPAPQWNAPGPGGPEGWCCRAGEVFRARLKACEEPGGILFLTPDEAHHHCEAQRRTTPMPPQGDIVPQGHQSDGWCCLPGEVFPAPARVCEERGGILFPTSEDAHRHCGPRGDIAPMRPNQHPVLHGRQTDGWCCRDGEVLPAPHRACEAQGGASFPTPEDAHLYCSGRGRGVKNEPRHGDRPVEATPITLPGPRGVMGEQPAPDILPAPVLAPAPETRGGIQPPPEMPQIPGPDAPPQQIDPDPAHGGDVDQRKEHIFGDSPVEATPITLP